MLTRHVQQYRLTPTRILIMKVVIHAISLLFVTLLVYNTLNGGFGADPVKGIEHFTGKAALNTLILTLLLSPLAKKYKQGGLIRLRRLLGVYSFFWVALHLSAYLALDLNFDWALLGSEIIKRPYLAIGAVSGIILLLLALTSPQAVQRRLGKSWQKLHNWVYLALILSPIHYYWSVKSDIIEPSIYLLICTCLLYCRKQKLSKWFTKTNNQYSTKPASKVSNN
ncbi:sulfite oxidase subunit YedZ [Photobacterium kishitanii]|uniref:Protein-methionine-sulfoxide reductase heme-binding subunit MsrQ n=1 Tax=Photobacterium kishitanii TaxID=318456 RepID=A0AAX0YXE4_9GAMM|nr:protein-methionine-sulfoxide reductase heme-binding subunit MsrQ [Photobacterium kishitanii]KJG59818.1 sulfite oxidase subunit YedZ [Photobacterium kishitanii]KJG63102.1 sulfite oxidase subunit YedZ [Photobacterium kishitanii]KJG71275.1 sulfite oxidase subunit YedZ [Photobacterium kishitanii]PSX20396.1 protein-methionine-sulfoxide reductase heme-binding subunit MsrQ [Photobacterium kishitanii]PSX29157.1 protein-methionine-sulfoxide reductase heme-binding subunit MsrQ [Photobacterium kishita